ncbi:TPA: hypothetical protein ACGIK9_003261 [Acinetobacter baumannii]|uniref:hypothetical protein n=1 Tax=Acinetobacter baumannii TaxID=470 RepID=UPI00338FCA19
MANICNNLIKMKCADYYKIAHLFSTPENSYEANYLDFNKIIPVPEGGSAQSLWGVKTRPYATILDIDNFHDYVRIEFQTHCYAPTNIYSALITKFEITFEAFAFEPASEYGFYGEYEPFADHSDELPTHLITTETGRDWADEACMQIMGKSLDEYNSDNN